jgi:hypothetical protein
VTAKSKFALAVDLTCEHYSTLVAHCAGTCCNAIITATAYFIRGTHYTERQLPIISGYRNPQKDKTMQYDILGIHRGVAEDSSLLGCYTVWLGG